MEARARKAPPRPDASPVSKAIITCSLQECTVKWVNQKCERLMCRIRCETNGGCHIHPCARVEPLASSSTNILHFIPSSATNGIDMPSSLSLSDTRNNLDLSLSASHLSTAPSHTASPSIIPSAASNTSQSIGNNTSHPSGPPLPFNEPLFAANCIAGPSSQPTDHVLDPPPSTSILKASSLVKNGQLHAQLSRQLNSVWWEGFKAAESSQSTMFKSKEAAIAADLHIKWQFILIFWDNVHCYPFVFITASFLTHINKDSSCPSLWFIEAKDIPNWPVWTLQDSPNLLPSLSCQGTPS
jgi:hypothetical protein